MGFCSCTAKFILFFFNLACALLGLAVLAVGVYGKVSSHTYGGVSGTSAIIVIVFGAAITLISFFGCWGAIQENRCLLNTYGVILSVLLIGLIALGAVIISNKGKAEDQVDNFIIKIFEGVQRGNEASIKEVNAVQQAVECCGLDGPSWWAHIGKAVPISCCKGQNNGDFCNDLKQAYQSGCEDKASEIFRGLVQLMGVFAIVVGGVEFLGVFMSFFLAHSIKRQELRQYT